MGALSTPDLFRNERSDKPVPPRRRKSSHARSSTSTAHPNPPHPSPIQSDPTTLRYRGGQKGLTCFFSYLEGWVSLYGLPTLVGDLVDRASRFRVDTREAVAGPVPDPQVGRPLLPLDHGAGAVLAGLKTKNEGKKVRGNVDRGNSKGLGLEPS